MSFAKVAAAPPAPTATHPIPTGSWSVYYHEPEDKSWTAESYKRLQIVNSWEALGQILRELGPHKTTNGLLRIMRGDVIAEGVITASRAVSLSVPLVVRMKGTNEDIGKKMLADSGLPIIAADTMEEAAQKVVAAANAH